MTTMLSENFSLEELCKSDTALRCGIDNWPDDQATIENLTRVCQTILQPVRNHFGVPFRPTSGYRCAALNEAINGSENSQHMKGEAADFEVPAVSNFDLATWISENLKFDQLILEFYTPGEANSGWVHCSVTGGTNRHQMLTIGGGRSLNGLTP